MIHPGNSGSTWAARTDRFPALRPDPDRQRAVRAAFEAFPATPEIKEKLLYVFDAERVVSKMNQFYVGLGQNDPEVKSFTVSSPVKAGGQWWFRLDITAPEEARETIIGKSRVVPAGKKR